MSVPAPTRGAIHDLGYKRYLGSRLPSSTRWRVIMREQIKSGWKKWWRYKLALGGSVVTAFVAGGLLYFLSDRIIRSGGLGPGTGLERMAMKFADGVVPLALPWFFRMAFVLSLTLGASIIANDTRSGAFTFYYVRSVRPWDYVLGKLAGYGFLVATLVIVGPFLLAWFRLGMSDSADQFLEQLGIVPKVLAVCALATLVYTAVPLAVSALVPNHRYALAVWAAYYLIVGLIALGIGQATDTPISALDIPTALSTIIIALFDLSLIEGVTLGVDAVTATLALLAQGVVAIGLIWYQVSRDQRHGVGGAS